LLTQAIGIRPQRWWFLGFCVGVVVVVAFVVPAAIATIGPARAHAYFDPSTGA